MSLEWNVLRYDCNGRRIIFFNIFSHAGFMKDVKELFAETGLNDREFEERLRSDLQYHFWCRCEYEVVICSWPRGDCDKKIDIFDQVMANQRQFLNYIKECRDVWNSENEAENMVD